MLKKTSLAKVGTIIETISVVSANESLFLPPSGKRSNNINHTKQITTKN